MIFIPTSITWVDSWWWSLPLYNGMACLCVLMEDPAWSAIHNMCWYDYLIETGKVVTYFHDETRDGVFGKSSYILFNVRALKLCTYTQMYFKRANIAKNKMKKWYTIMFCYDMLWHGLIEVHITYTINSLRLSGTHISIVGLGHHWFR